MSNRLNSLNLWSLQSPPISQHLFLNYILYKKTDRHKVENYPPSNPGPNIAKILSKMIEKRIQNNANDQQPAEQARFGESFSTIDRPDSKWNYRKMFGIPNWPIEAFLDYNKTFDSFKHNFLFSAPRNQGIPESFIKIIQKMYTGLRARTVTEMERKYFDVKKGIKQGDSYPRLCSIVHWRKSTEKWNGIKY